MKSTDLFLLGRRLMKLAEEGLPRQGVNNSARIVLIDVAANPGSSINEIKDRTGYPQSHVSMSVIKLRELGFVQTDVDSSDRRRTLVWVVPEAVQRAHSRVTSTADVALSRALGDPPESELAEIVGALERLAARLDPSAAAQMIDQAS